jgi:hypothetical protein
VQGVFSVWLRSNFKCCTIVVTVAANGTKMCHRLVVQTDLALSYKTTHFEMHYDYDYTLKQWPIVQVLLSLFTCSTCFWT